MAILYVGIDLAKNVFAVHGVDEHGKAVLVRPSVPRGRLHQLVAALPPCTIGMEACSGAHHWARLFAQHGHTVRLMAPKFVAPYRMGGKRGKNDAADAQAICEAVQRPNMRFVPVKSQDEQARLCIHRVRQGLVEQRTATINRVRGLMSEFGIVLAPAAHLEDLPGWANTAVGDSLSELHRLDERIAEYDHHVVQMAREDERSQALMQLQGIGSTTASALVSTIRNARDFKNGRQLAAWLLARPGARSVQLGRQEPPGQHHQGGRWLPANAARARCQGSACRGQDQGRPAQPLGDGARGQTWLLEGGHRHRRQERPHGLGSASQGRELQATRGLSTNQLRLPATA
jgi:transposase